METGRVPPFFLYSRTWTLARWSGMTSYWLSILLQQPYALLSASLGASIKRSRSRSIRSNRISHPQYDPPPLPIRLVNRPTVTSRRDANAIGWNIYFSKRTLNPPCSMMFFLHFYDDFMTSWLPMTFTTHLWPYHDPHDYSGYYPSRSRSLFISYLLTHDICHSRSHSLISI